MRLIDADKVKSKLQQHRDLFVDAWGGFDKMSLADKNRVDEIDNCIAEIVNAPTIEAAPVVHGRWIPIEYDGYADGYPVWDLWECSECREEHSGDEDTLTPYCPNCGAKMDKGDGDG